MRRPIMNRAPKMKPLESDPKLLASLIADDDDIGERIWQPDDLAARPRPAGCCSRASATCSSTRSRRSNC